MTMATLIALGAPQLPAGYFYRVRRTWLDGTFVQVRRSTRWGSRLVMRDRVRLWTEGEYDRHDNFRCVVAPRHVPVDEAIVTAAKSAHFDALQSIRLDHWKGDHR